ncbi:MAG: hypothetical protein V1867_00945 [Candidatus Falkowbacteria bacterium]
MSKCNKCNTIKKEESGETRPKVVARTAKNKKLLLDELEKSKGIVTIACKRIGINPKTYYQWLKCDKEFAEKADDIEWIQRGFVEDKLVKKIANDDITAIIFYLKCNHPKFKPKSEIDVNDSRELEQIRSDYDGLIKKLKVQGDAKSKTANHTPRGA